VAHNNADAPSGRAVLGRIRVGAFDPVPQCRRATLRGWSAWRSTAMRPTSAAKRSPASATASRRIEADDIDAFTYSGQNRI
jgi:hypothetical protein